MALTPPIVITNATRNLRTIDKINSFIEQWNDIIVTPQLTPLSRAEINFIDNDKYSVLAKKVRDAGIGISLFIPKEAYNNNTEIDYIVNYVNENYNFGEDQ
jgi:hypothetical protein